LSEARRRYSDMRPIPRRGLSRTEAAMYVGVSPTKFDELVRDGRMPKPLPLDGRKLWDLRKLDIAFDALDDSPTDSSWDDFNKPAQHDNHQTSLRPSVSRPPRQS
jgi:predicted DNA-binding transcriptional regulator AlpA